MSEGKLPSFARLRQEGAYGRLLSRKPLLSPVVWTTIATGKTPDQHGIGHFVAIDESTGESLPVTSEMRRVKAVWQILSDASKTVGVVGWWTTWPAETVNGAIVSDHICYHFLFTQGAEGHGARGPQDTSGLTYPPELFAQLAPFVRRPQDVQPEEATPFVQVSREEFSRPFDFDDPVSHFKWALATAESYRSIGLQLWRERPDLLMVYIEGTDSIAHLFGHLFRAGPLSGELAEQQKKFGAAVEQMYVYADRLVGEYIKAMDSDTTLVVASDHGFDLGATQDDPSKTRDMRRVSERFHRMEGVLYMFGNRVKRGRLQEATILDIAPTLLALSGLPPPLDMPGRVLIEGLDLEVPGPPVASYESQSSTVEEASRDARINPQMLERLRSLGYLGGSPNTSADAPTGGMRSPQGERNIAALHFEAGRHQEAMEVYAKLVREEPDDASLRASLAGVLGALERYEEADEHLDIAIGLDPVNVEAHHNRAVVLERQGRIDAALEHYRTAVLYSPQYEPSRRALIRLTGSVGVRTPRTEAEKRALALAEAASQAARRGDYAEAMKRLAEAQQSAPRYVLVYQYQANVAYLMDDIPGAINALEKAIALEPGNALFRANLKSAKERQRRERRR